MEQAKDALDTWHAFLEKLTPVNPVLADHLSQWKNARLSDYAEYIWQGLSRERNSVVSTSFLHALDRLNLKNGDGLKKSLVNNATVLSAHHTAPIFHPIAFQILLLANAARNTPQVMPVLSTDWVPMDNLFYPRGVLLPAERGLKKFNIFAKSCNKICVSHMPAFTKPDVDKLHAEISRAFRANTISVEQYKQYSSLLDIYFYSEQVLEQSQFKDQCSLLNQLMCAELFPNQNFAFLNISDIAKNVIVSELHDEASLIRWLLMDESARSYFISLLDGESACWSIRQGKGSILFWQIKEGRMQPLLHYAGNSLSNDGYHQKLTAEALLEALEGKNIIPGMALVFSLLMFQCGLSCVGGMRQIAYNRVIKNALQKVVLRYRPEFARQLDVPADAFAAGVYPCLNNTGQPVSVTEAMLQPELVNPAYGGKPLTEAVLQAADDILTLSG